MNGRQSGDHPPGRLREVYVLATADKYTFRVDEERTRRRSARRSRSCSTSLCSTCAPPRSPSKPKRRGDTAGRTRALEEGRRAGRPGQTIPIFQGLEADLSCRSVSPSPLPRSPLRHLPGLRGDHEDRAREEPRRGSDEVRRAQLARPQDRRHRGGGAKRLYRMIDFKRRKDGVPAKVAAIEYDPNRTAYIALLHYVDGEKATSSRRTACGSACTSSPARASTSRSATAAAGLHAGRHPGAQRRAPARPRRPACPLRRRRHPADGQGGRLRRRCACPPARCAWSARSAARPWAWSATPTTRTSRSARPAASVTWASARRRAARP